MRALLTLTRAVLTVLTAIWLLQVVAQAPGAILRAMRGEAVEMVMPGLPGEIARAIRRSLLPGRD